MQCLGQTTAKQPSNAIVSTQYISEGHQRQISTLIALPRMLTTTHISGKTPHLGKQNLGRQSRATATGCENLEKEEKGGALILTGKSALIPQVDKLR
jgi:hypothetical protein